MTTLEFVLPEGNEAEVFNAALYRFLERALNNETQGDAPLAIWCSTPVLRGVLKSVKFSSAEQAAAFESFWRSYDPARTSGTA
jgi:hypothetical protein